ncbi:hypothetical protein [Streptomyces sp. NPDC088923]|uniref:hypothetical protein n=1 Tax=Streptomyces sp. NPDC088923 TaxID=3365913 RepID=UPI00381B4B0C
MPSRVPEVLDALTAQLAALPALAGVRVVDGPELGGGDDLEWVLVGFDGDPAGAFQAAQAAGGWASPVNTSREETWQVVCAVVVGRGDTAVRPARVRAYEIAASVEELLALDPSLGLPSLEAAVDTSELAQVQTGDGIQVRLLLTIGGRAFT